MQYKIFVSYNPFDKARTSLKKTQHPNTKPILVAVSGSGRLLLHLLQEQKQHRYHICGVISSHRECAAVGIAQNYNLDLHYDTFPIVETQKPQAFPKLTTFIERHGPKLIVLAGFIRPFPVYSKMPIINIHPSILPHFSGKGLYGHRVHRAVLKARKKISGASCHMIDACYDEGPLISQITVKVQPDDTVDALADRVLSREKNLLSHTIDHVLGML